MLKNVICLITLCLFVFVITTNAQKKSTDRKTESTDSKASKKANQRPTIEPSKAASLEPFDKVTVDAMANQCVKLETEAGVVELEMFPESAPESVRSFLNLAATGAFDTTTFSRVVPGFIVQGGDLFTRRKMTTELDKRARRAVIDEPSQIKHERSIVSMARGESPNSATTNFFILVGEARHLDGTFAAFGKVIKGMEVVDAINKMSAEGEKPTKPVRITRAMVAPCLTNANP